MSDTWSNLLSGVVGAIVGGAASLAGTVLVNKIQMATAARMRMYDELVPGLERAIDDYLGWPNSKTADKAAAQVHETMAALRRASALAGRRERRAIHDLALHWAEFRRASDHVASFRAPSPYSPVLPQEPTPDEESALKAWRADAEVWGTLLQMRDEKYQALLAGVRALSTLLEAKLG